MKVTLTIIFTALINLFGIEAKSQDTVYTKIYSINSSEQLEEAREWHIITDDYKLVDLEMRDTVIYDSGNFPERIANTYYASIESIFGSFGFQESDMKTEYVLEYQNQELQGTERISTCLNRQLICREPCVSETDKYVVYYCNGQIRTISDSCSCWGNQCGGLGKTKWFYPDGTLESEGEYTNLVPDGKGERYLQFYNIGEWKYYNESGKLIKKTTWNYMDIVSEEKFE